MKLVILDLDDTIWEGDIFNNNEVKLKPETKEVLRQLDKADITLTVCSHNRLEDVEKKLKELDLDRYFTHIEASLRDEKDVMVKRIIKKFNYDPLETLFIDDAGINRDLVRNNVGCHVDFFEDLYQVFKYINTDRLKTMVQQRGMEKAQKLFKGTLKDFIKQSKLQIQIRTAREEDLPRIVALTQRTNHLNATQERYTKEDIIRFGRSYSYEIYVVFAEDKYCQYGLIGEVIIQKEKDDRIILDLCISCRVMNRGIGSRLITWIKSEVINKGENLIGRLRHTDKNDQMKRLFEKSGLKFLREDIACFV